MMYLCMWEPDNVHTSAVYCRPVNKQLCMIYVTPQAHIPISTPETRPGHISIGFTCMTNTTLLQGQAVHTCADFRQSG